MVGEMNGAESLVRTLLAGGVDVCFTNPGTSEMHFVAALDKVPGMRCVLGLFEGVVTGAADGDHRIAGTAGVHPAASGAWPRQWTGQPPQRQEGKFRHRQYRRRACHLSHCLRRPVDRRHRRGGGAHVALGQDLARRPFSGGGRRLSDPGGAANAWADRNLDPACGHGLGRGRRGRRDGASRAPRQGVGRCRQGGRRHAPQRGKGNPADGLAMPCASAVSSSPGGSRPRPDAES